MSTKMKSNKAAQKRMRVLPGGKIKRKQSGKAHMALNKRRKSVRNANKTEYVFEGEARSMKTLVQKGMK